MKRMNKEQLGHIISVLVSAEQYVGNTPTIGANDLVYRTPAMAMREAADAYEARDALAVEYHRVIELLREAQQALEARKDDTAPNS